MRKKLDIKYQKTVLVDFDRIVNKQILSSEVPKEQKHKALKNQGRFGNK